MIIQIAQQKQISHLAPKAKRQAIAQRTVLPETPQLSLARSLGTRGMQRLAINQPGDPFEQEADRVAHGVIGMPTPAVGVQPVTSKGLPVLQEFIGEDEGLLCKESSATGEVAPPVVNQVLQSPGQPLQPEARAFFEPRFGVDFAGVRLHIGELAAESAQAVQARAFTVGQHIVFGKNEYSPQSREGRRVIAHELAHVVQQGATRRLSHAPGLMVQRQITDLALIPAQERARLHVGRLETTLPADLLGEVFPQPGSSQGPGTTYNHGGPTSFGSNISQNHQRGLQSVADYLANQTNALPLNSSLNIQLNLTPYSGADSVYRFTHFQHTQGQTTSNAMLIELVGAAVTPTAVTVPTGSFQVRTRSFNLSGTWTDARFGLLQHALNLMPDAALDAAQGLTFLARSGASSTGEPGEFDQDNDRVILYRNAFPTSPVRFGQAPHAVFFLLHEIGHALDLRPLAQAWQQFNQAGQTAAARQRLLAARALSGSRWQSPTQQEPNYTQTLDLDATSGAFRQAVRQDGVRRDTSGRTTPEGATAGLSGGVTTYSDVDYQELFAESYALYIADPERLRLLRPNTYQYFAGRYPRPTTP